MNTPLLIIWPHFEIDEQGRAVVGDLMGGSFHAGQSDLTTHSYVPVRDYHGLDTARRLELGPDDRQAG